MEIFVGCPPDVILEGWKVYQHRLTAQSLMRCLVSIIGTGGIGLVIRSFY